MLIHFIFGLAGSFASVVQKGREKQSENHNKSLEIILCFFTLNFPLKKAETKIISQMNSKLYSGISNKIWTCSLFISISLHISHWHCFYFFQHTLVTYPYQSVITFGGYRDDFMVVTSQQREPGVGKKTVEKLVFAMAKPKVCLLCLTDSWVCTNWIKFSICHHMWGCHLSFLMI